MEFQISSNGLASGNHPLEALCAALYEAVERDAIACHVWSRDTFGRRIPRVDLSTVEHPLVLELLERLEAAHVGVIMYDLAVDTDVPVYMVNIYDREDRHLGVYGGYGAHLDPQVAMLRALTEAVQARLIYIAGSRDDHFRHDYLRARQSDSARAIRRLQSLPQNADGRARRDESTPTFEGDVQVILQKLARVGLPQVLVADLTREEIGIPVMRVFVPGLEGYPGLPHYSPGPRARAFARAYAESA
jgi:ribosomal protein S12 methylthiotransferase accessory factor